MRRVRPCFIHGMRITTRVRGSPAWPYTPESQRLWRPMIGGDAAATLWRIFMMAQMLIAARRYCITAFFAMSGAMPLRAAVGRASSML